MNQFKNYVDGEWVDCLSKAKFEQRNPANLGEVTGLWPDSAAEDAREAIHAAHTAYSGWRNLTLQQRASFLKNAVRLMKARRDAIAATLTGENGKTLNESKAEIDSAIAESEYQIGVGLQLQGQAVPSLQEGLLAYETRVPLGVASIICPWNFPFNVPARKCIPALIAGNTCIVKPASLTPHTGTHFVELFADAGIPKGVINCITGSGSRVGRELVTNPAIKAVSFTGSTEVGRAIHSAAAGIMARTQLEMGGKNPVIVLEDAPLKDAADSAVKAAFACAGQWCTSTSRVIVLKSIAEQMTSLILERAEKITVGNGMDESTSMGPVCGEKQVKTILGYIKIGEKEGARLILGGGRVTGEDFKNGCFIQPTIFTDVKPDMTIAREEIFGPVLGIIEVNDFEEAVAVANSVPYGLSSSIYTNNLDKALTYIEKMDSGLTHINMMTAAKHPQLSFGGVKSSGYGTPESGLSGIQFFTEHKVAYIKYR